MDAISLVCSGHKHIHTNRSAALRKCKVGGAERVPQAAGTIMRKTKSLLGMCTSTKIQGSSLAPGSPRRSHITAGCRTLAGNVGGVYRNIWERSKVRLGNTQDTSEILGSNIGKKEDEKSELGETTMVPMMVGTLDPRNS